MHSGLDIRLVKNVWGRGRLNRKNRIKFLIHRKGAKDTKIKPIFYWMLLHPLRLAENTTLLNLSTLFFVFIEFHQQFFGN